MFILRWWLNTLITPERERGINQVIFEPKTQFALRGTLAVMDLLATRRCRNGHHTFAKSTLAFPCGLQTATALTCR